MWYSQCWCSWLSTCAKTTIHPCHSSCSHCWALLYASVVLSIWVSWTLPALVSWEPYSGVGFSPLDGMEGDNCNSPRLQGEYVPESEFGFLKNYSIVALHCCVSYRCTAKWFRYIWIDRYVCVLVTSVMSDSVMLWTVAHQAPLSTRLLLILQARLFEWVAFSFSNRWMQI